VGHPGQARGPAIWTVWPLVTAGVVACVLVLCLSWWLSESIENKVRANVRNALEAVHRATARSVDDWLNDLDQEVRAWARSAPVRDALARPATASSGGDADLLAPLMSVPSLTGYLLMDDRGRVLASDDVGRLGQPQGGGLEDILFSELGRTPDHSVLVLPDGGRRDSPTDLALRRDILVAAEVPGSRGNAGGVLVFRLDPRLDLSRMLERGRLGESGETYVFDRAGWIVSESGFRDEGAPAGGSAATPRREQIRTRMTLSALTGRSGLDLSGYRDYRGIPVVGAWTWNERYGIGIATEIELDEAFGVLGDYQRQTRLSTGLSLLLIAGLSGMFVFNRLAMSTASAKLETAYEIIRGTWIASKKSLRSRAIPAHMVPRDFGASRSRRHLHPRHAPPRPRGRRDFYDSTGSTTPTSFSAPQRTTRSRRAVHGRHQDVDQDVSHQEPSIARLVTGVNAEPRQRQVHVRDAVRRQVRCDHRCLAPRTPATSRRTAPG
jgi:hypothetical protein